MLELPPRIISHSRTLTLPGAFAAILNLPLGLPVTKSQYHDGKLHMERELEVITSCVTLSTFRCYTPMEMEHEVIISSCVTLSTSQCCTTISQKSYNHSLVCKK